MLNLNCSICVELFTDSDCVLATPCGHLYHHSCLFEWIERSSTCPQCRDLCTDDDVIRIYFNLANIDDNTVDDNRIDVGALQEQLENANYELLKQHVEFEKREAFFKASKDVLLKHRKVDLKVINDLIKANTSLKSYIQNKEHTSNALEARVSALNRELRQSLKKESVVKNLLIKERIRMCGAYEHACKLQERIKQLENENNKLQQKLKTYEHLNFNASNNTKYIAKNNRKRVLMEDQKLSLSTITKMSIMPNEKLPSVKTNKANSKKSAGVAGVPKSNGTSRKTSDGSNAKYSKSKKPRLTKGVMKA